LKEEKKNNVELKIEMSRSFWDNFSCRD